jgi:hypothetical protein
MEYLLLIYSNESAMQKAPKEATAQMHNAYVAYTEAMQKAGVMVGGNRLRPATEATTVRSPNGKKSVLNGPFAETKEQLGGIFVTELPDLDEAIRLASLGPAAEYGTLEIRPLVVR